jgi:hypothetical protein
LIPHQAKERFRKQVLVEFFREEVFGHAPDQRCLACDPSKRFGPFEPLS